MQLSQGLAVELRHVQDRRSNPKLSENVRNTEEDPGNLSYTDIGRKEDPRHHQSRAPGKNLSCPFSSGSPGKAAGKFSVQLAVIFLLIRAHLELLTSAFDINASVIQVRLFVHQIGSLAARSRLALSMRSMNNHDNRGNLAMSWYSWVNRF